MHKRPYCWQKQLREVGFPVVMLQPRPIMKMRSRQTWLAYALYPGTTPISAAEITAYLADPAVAYNPTDALKLINTQYWIVSLRNGTEAFANFRRTGFPALTPNPFNNNLNGGFARRLSYPDVEASANTANYNAAAAAIGGDKLTSRVFWDIP